MDKVINAFLLSTIAGFSSLIALILMYIKVKNPKTIIITSLACAGGVMITVSILDLIPKSISLLKQTLNLNNVLPIVILSILIGSFISKIISTYIPENNDKLYKIGMVSLLAIILHNIPEGIATFLSYGVDQKLGISLAISIAFHNIPEAISIVIPLYYATKNKRKEFFYVLISALSEPFGSLLALLFLKNSINNISMGIILSMIAGIMIYIAIFELIINAKKYNKHIQLILSIIFGISFMTIIHFLI